MQRLCIWYVCPRRIAVKCGTNCGFARPPLLCLRVEVLESFFFCVSNCAFHLRGALDPSISATLQATEGWDSGLMGGGVVWLTLLIIMVIDAGWGKVGGKLLFPKCPHYFHPPLRRRTSSTALSETRTGRMGRRRNNSRGCSLNAGKMSRNRWFSFIFLTVSVKYLHSKLQKSLVEKLD